MCVQSTNRAPVQPRLRSKGKDVHVACNETDRVKEVEVRPSEDIDGVRHSAPAALAEACASKGGLRSRA